MTCRFNGTGDFDCLFGFPCNQTTGICDCTNSIYFAQDTVLFITNNCGLPIIGLDVGYVLAAVFAMFVSLWSLREGRKRAIGTKRLLYIGALWTILLPFLQLSHFLEGRRFGFATVTLFYIIIQLVNIQVVMFSFQIFALLAILAKPAAIRKLRLMLLAWLAFWSLLKIIPTLLLYIALSIHSTFFFNAVMFTWGELLVIEVAIMTTWQYFCYVKVNKRDGRFFA